jgi:hypothetical protein
MERLAQLSDRVQNGTYNQALKIFGLQAGAEAFQITGELKNTSCSWCRLHVGQIYYRGQFMPYLPKHPHCPHTYTALSGGELAGLTGLGSLLGGSKSSLWWLLPWLLYAASEEHRKTEEAKTKQKNPSNP